MANRTTAHGLTEDTRRKIAASYDVELERQARDWITALTNEEFTTPVGADNFHMALKDGQLLCKLVNAIRPGIVKKVNTSKMVFKEQENISMFLKAAVELGVQNFSTFQTVDLYENRNMPQVLNTLHALGSITKDSGFKGPVFGVKVADKNVREFDEETIAKGKMHSSLLTAGTNKGASQAGMTGFGTQRKL